MSDREVMQMALEALEASRIFLAIEVNRAIGNDRADATIREAEESEHKHARAIAALRARLAEPEPVGTCGRRTEGGEMTRDEIMELAQGTAGQHWMDEAHIQRFASALIAAEREAILRHAQPAHDVDGHCEIVTVTAIRARGEK